MLNDWIKAGQILPGREVLAVLFPQAAATVSLSLFIILGLELSDTKSTSLNYEPSLELLLITAKQLFLNRDLHHSAQLGRPQPETRNLELDTRNPKPETPESNPGTRNPQPATRNPKPETRNPEPETPNPKLTIRNMKAKRWTQVDTYLPQNISTLFWGLSKLPVFNSDIYEI